MRSCAVKFCKQKDTAVMWKQHPVCDKHWEKHCDDNDKFNLNGGI